MNSRGIIDPVVDTVVPDLGYRMAYGVAELARPDSTGDSTGVATESQIMGCGPSRGPLD